MVSIDNGAFVQDIYERFGKLGYTINHEILDASNYGIPQSRKRVFFIGIKNNKFIFPDKFDQKISTKEALSDLPTIESSTSYISKAMNEYQKDVRKLSRSVSNHDMTHHSTQTIDVISKVPDGGNIRSLPEKYWKIRKFNKAFQRMDSSLPSLTIDTGHRNYFHYKENRIPTVRESARIQSFSDDFKFLGSKTSQYKQVGNAVPPKLAFILATEL
jgi:DNA (cytosine-5)-methyltransferase 1